MTLRRGKPLERKTPLKRGKALQARSGSLEPGRAGLARTGRLKPISDRRRAEKGVRDEEREATFARDSRTCQVRALIVEAGYAEWARCSGPITFHHLQKSGQGGAYDRENGLTACAGHNSWVENYPAYAKSLGLVR